MPPRLLRELACHVVPDNHVEVVVDLDVHLDVVDEVPVAGGLLVAVAGGGDGGLALHELGEVVVLHVPQRLHDILLAPAAQIVQIRLDPQQPLVQQHEVHELVGDALVLPVVVAVQEFEELGEEELDLFFADIVRLLLVLEIEPDVVLEQLRRQPHDVDHDRDDDDEGVEEDYYEQLEEKVSLFVMLQDEGDVYLVAQALPVEDGNGGDCEQQANGDVHRDEDAVLDFEHHFVEAL